MSQLQITCLGTFQVLLDGASIGAFPTDKARGLLVYLALEKQAHERSALAQLLWPGYSEESANNSLRQTLHRLRQLLQDTKADPPWLLITRHSVQFNPAAPFQIDVTTFSELLDASYAHSHSQLATCQSCLERLRQAVALYGGDFLAGISIADSDPFEEWRRIIQEQCHVAALDALQLLTDACDTSGDFEEAQRFAERQIALEPWREQAHRQLMRVLARAGRRGAALAQYHACRQLLLEELGSEPEALTTSLYEQIRSGELEERKPVRKPIPSAAPQSEGQFPALPEEKSEKEVSLARSLASEVALQEIDDTHDADLSSVSSSPLPPSPDVELAVAPVSSTQRHNLPSQLTPPLGRQAMIERTRAALAVAPVVTLTGVGGVGKTTLALQVANTLLDEYADGVWLVELARLADAQLLPATLATALGLREAAETQLLDTLISYLQSKELLLLLDNCEHLIAATHQLCSQLRTSCPHVRILATSRAPLRLREEQVLAVAPLPTPTTLPPIAELLNYPAVQLFVTRVQAINPRFTLTDEHAATVLEICQRLDGLPLALELAAARVRLLSLKEIAERLDRRFSLLRATPNGLFANGALRHQTLRATIDWGYELLSEAEQRLFRHLAVFTGGFTLAAVEAMRGEDVLDLLAALVDKSFVVHERNAQSNRFYLLDSLRDYALEKLTAADEEAAARQHHLTYFLQLAEQAETYYNSPSQLEWFNRIAGVHDNLRAALAWALRPAAGSAILALRLVGALGCFWEVRGHLSEAKEALLRALTIVQADSAVNQWRAKALYWAGGVLRLLGDYGQAKALLQESLALHQSLHNQAGVAQVFIRLGMIWDDEGQYDEALRYYEESHRIYQQLSDNWGIAVALNNRSSIAYYRGDYVTARRLAEESVARIRTTGDQRHLANFLTTLAEATQLLQDFATTHQALAEAFAIHSAIGDKMRSTAVLCGWAEVDRMQGDTLQARQRYLQSLSLAFALWERRRIAISLEGVARCTAALGDPQLAVELWSVAATLRSIIGSPLPPAQIPDYEAELAAAKQSLGEEVFSRAWDTGRWLSLDQALRKAEAWEGRQEDKGNELPSHLVTLAPLLDWAEMPAVDLFVERRAEVAQLTAWLAPTAVGMAPARLISILGMGGMGKTTLAAVVTKEVADNFAVVIWRSLLNAPPLSELLHSWLQTLSRQTLTTLPDSLDEQLRLLLTYLQQEHCLLVLDNVESLFAAELPGDAPQSRAGVVRPGYEGYDPLFQRLASSDHQSCLLLTSREQPYALLRSGRQAQTSGRVQVLPLTGLDQQAAYALLQSNGLHTSAAEAAQLVKNYSGNPLALQIVAATIADFFGGDVAAFRQEEGALFDGMRLVLDQQFARLSPLEREILIWLAIEREPVTVPMLRSNFMQPVATAPLLEALQALQNRSLLEKSEQGLTLQNVIIEYTTEYLVAQICRELSDEQTTLVDSVAQSFLNRFALLKAQSKEYTRQSQERLILQPVAMHWQKSWEQKQENIHGQPLLNALRQSGVRHGYAAGNLLNLLLYLGVDLNGYDCSRLSVWQADLRRSVVRNVNLTQADLSNSAFIQTFSRIENVAISPNGQLLAAAGDGGAIRIFRLPNGEPHHLLTGHTNTVTSVNFSPDGAYLASTGDDGLVLLWAIQDGQLHRQLGEYLAMRVVTFSPDGRLLAGASRSGMVLLWQVENGHLLRTLPLHNQRVDALAFHPDGNLLASASSDGSIRLLDVSNLLQDKEIQSGEGAIMRDPQQVSRHVRNLITDPQAGFFTVAFSPDGQRLVAGSVDGKLVVWDTEFDTATHQVLGHRGQIRTVVFCADSRFFFSGGYDGAIRLWDSRDMRCCQTLSGHKETVYSLALGWHDQLMASGSEDATICLWEINTQTQSILRQRLYGYPQALECVAWSGCGRWLATGDIHGSARLWDLQHATPRCTQEIIGESTVISLSFSQDGKQLVIGRYADPKGVQIWELGADSQWYLRGGKKPPQSGVACFSSDASLLATCASDGTLHLWNTQPLAERAASPLFSGHRTYVNRMTFTAKGQTIATCSSDLSVRLWRVDTGEETHCLPGFGNNTCLAINPQGTLLACSAPNFAIALWNVAEPAPEEPLYHLMGHTNEAFACAFSPDGQLLVSAGLDRSVRLWDVQSGTQRALLGYHEQYALDVAFSPSGQQVASIGKEGALYIWQINPYKRLHQLHAPGPYAGMNITGTTGISDAQKATLRALGAVDDVEDDKKTPTTGAARLEEKESEARPDPVTWSPGHLVTPTPLLDWAEMPTVDLFIERSAEVAELTSWLTPTKSGASPARFISILGMGGMGKTTLAAVVTKAVAANFAVVIWRSLLNAPPIADLLHSWLQTLSRQTLTTPPDSLDEQLRLLLNNLQQERCLLVLDNVESIFAATPSTESSQSRAGVVRSGYEGYDQLFQRLASGEHQSCLLLTSREQPYALLRSGRQAQMSGRIQMLPLTGLDSQAGSMLLQNNGLHTSGAEAAQLVKSYSGNPLALQIVASTIADFFGGDVTAFRQEEGALFDGMRVVLDQQFARLSSLEREILIWLAIEREAITVPTLRSNFCQPVATAPLIEALQALQNRSLLEKRNEGFTLQNVIIEYMIEYLVEQVYQELVGGGGWIVEGNANHPPAALPMSFFNRFALMKAQAKEYVRQSQRRLLVQPLAERLTTTLGRAEVTARLPYLLERLRAAKVRTGYAVGNLLNLLVHLEGNLTALDCSQLAVWQADLRGVMFAAMNFTGADLTNTAFTANIETGKIKFLPSGELLIAGISKGELCLWRTVDGQLTAAFSRTTNSRLPLIFSEDGNWIVVVDLNYTIQLWSTEQGICVQNLTGHHSPIHTLAMSKDGTQLASGSVDGVVNLWEWRQGQRCQQLNGYQLGIGALAFSPDGNTLATGSGDGIIRLWDSRSPATDGRLLTTLQAHNHSVGALAFSPDGRWLASGDHGSNILLWDLQNEGTPARHLQGHTHIIRNLCFQPSAATSSSVGSTGSPTDAYLLASSSADRTVRLWSLSGELRYTLLGHTDDITALDFSADGRRLASSGSDQIIYWWDARTGQMVNSLHAYRYIPTTVVRFSPDGELVVSGSADQLVRLWPVMSGESVTLPTESTGCAVLRGHTHFVRAVAVSPNGHLIASGSADHTIRLWERTTHTELQKLTGHTGAILSLAFTRTDHSGTLLASASGDGSIRLWSINEAKPTLPPRQRLLLGHQEEVLALTFDPTGGTLVSGDMNGNVWIWDVESGTTRLRLTGHTAAVTMAAISADGRTLATSAFDQTVRLWNLQSGECLYVKKDEHVGTRTVVFVPQPGTDDELLAYDGDDFAIYLWPWRTGGPAYPLRGHSSVVLGLDVSPTAPHLVSISRDGTIRLWDLATRTCRQLFHAPGPYAGMKIGGVTGISEAQKAALKALGAIEE